MLGDRKLDTIALGLAICAVPISIAVTEIFLAIALLARLVLYRGDLRLPRLFWAWLPWAGLALASWLHSPDRGAGVGEMRHLALIAALFLVLPALRRASQAVAIWRGLLLAGTIGSAALIVEFAFRLVHYRRELAAAADPSFYLRSGGFLHHWMIYGTVEILIFAGLLQFWTIYPARRRLLTVAFAINGLAIYLSLTRTLWLSCLVVLAIHLVRLRSKWIWAVPVLPLVLFLVAPAHVRSRITESMSPSYYSNAERLQMLRVGWQMIVQAPFAGVGPGRVDKLYTGYLSPGDPVPAYHGHLHNNIVQLAAEFGLPVILAATFFVFALFLELRRRSIAALDPDSRFLCGTAFLGLAGYLTAGLFEYTYGHSLGLILLSFVTLAPVVVSPDAAAAVQESKRAAVAPLPS